MNVLVIRHAIARDRDEFAKAHPGEDDGARPLTGRGRKRMRRAACGLRRVAPAIDLLASSPLVRAVQTADIIEACCGQPKRIVVPQLAPEQAVTALLKWLQSQREDSTVALVGHEPQLSTFVGWMCTGLQESFIRLKKGGACLLRFDTDVKPGRATLLWSLAPAQLRRLGKS
jgi:phosphohistidine phosphatase